MACCFKFQYLLHHFHSFWKTVPFARRRFQRNFSTASTARNHFCNLQTPKLLRSSRTLVSKGYCSASSNATSDSPGVVVAATTTNTDPLNGRVMLIDGTSIIHRAYYKLLAKLHHGYLTHADGNGDWVLTIFTALSLIIDVLEFFPSHVVVVFDHDGIPFGHTCNSSKSFTAKGQNFRHNLYPSYKSNRPPTPDTIVQGLQYLKASIKAMSIKVIEVPGVEADDVIGTLALRSVDAGYKIPQDALCLEQSSGIIHFGVRFMYSTPDLFSCSLQHISFSNLHRHEIHKPRHHHVVLSFPYLERWIELGWSDSISS